VYIPDPIMEEYKIGSKPVFVVRDDLAAPFPGPNFSKIRGLYQHLLKAKEQGVREVVSQDTSISRCGWGCSWVCAELDLTHYNVYAQRKEMNFYQRMSEAWGGQMVPVRGSFSSAMVAQARKILPSDAYWIPSGLSVPETLHEHKALMRGLKTWLGGSVVVSVSSGTICAGLLTGVNGAIVYGIQSSSIRNRLGKIASKVLDAGLCGQGQLSLVDMGWEYKESVPDAPPFPCDIYLDRKAWRWLEENIGVLKEPVVFWNIGGEWSPVKGLVHGLRGDGQVTSSQLEEWYNGRQKPKGNTCIQENGPATSGRNRETQERISAN